MVTIISVHMIWHKPQQQRNIHECKRIYSLVHQSMRELAEPSIPHLSHNDYQCKPIFRMMDPTSYASVISYKDTNHCFCGRS